MAEPHHRPRTAEDLYDLHLEDVRAELLEGDVVCEPPAGFGHGVRASKIAYHLERFLEEHPLGVACGAETGFVLARAPDTVRAPDAAFVARERVERLLNREQYFEGAPDLAAEVVSPGDSARDVAAKVRDYLTAGTRLVWVIDPRRRTVTVHRPNAGPQTLGPEDHLDGGDLLPGFTLPVTRILD
jgi:Uma2 family endonuclease